MSTELTDLDDPVERIIDRYLRDAGEPADYAWYLAKWAAAEIRQALAAEVRP